MKKFIPLIFVFITSVLAAQNRGNDVVYFKNGSIIKGTLIKNPTDSTMAIKTRDGSVFVFNRNEIKRAEIAVINDRSVSGKHQNLWLGANLEPQFQNIFRSSKEVNSLALNNQTISFPGNGGLQMGFKLAYLPMGGIAGFETGLQYHFYQSRAIFSQLLLVATGYTPGYTTENNQFHNLEIPILINVHSYGKKVRFYSSDGISAGVTLGSKHSQVNAATGYTGWDTSFTSHADSTTTIYCTLLASAGIQISLSNNTLLNIAAAFRLSTNGLMGATNPFFVANATPFFPYSLSISVEILFHNPAKYKSRNGDFSVPSETLSDNTQDSKTRDRARMMHASWNNCFMILSNGDTVKGNVQKSADYSLTGGLFSRGKVLFAHTDGSEEKIGANKFIELYIPQEDSGYRKYITVVDNEDIGTSKVYRVVVDGKCQLLSGNITGSTPPLGAYEDEIEKFYFYYKDKLMPTNFKAASNKNQAFINTCKDFFSDCPALIQKIESQTIPSGDLSDMVKEFNKCIGSH